MTVNGDGVVGEGAGGQASAFPREFSHHLSGCSLLSLAGTLEITTSSWPTRVRADLWKQKIALTQN